MSERILKALMQLFGIITKQDGGVTEKERLYVERFLIQQISLDLVKEYIDLYEKHADWGVEKKEGDKQKLTSVKDSVSESYDATKEWCQSWFNQPDCIKSKSLCNLFCNSNCILTNCKCASSTVST